MANNPRGFHRRSIRLKGYDYTQPGAYFITLCTAGRELLFGEIIDGAMNLYRLGLIVQKAWLELPRHYPNVVLDAMVIMPNHVHAVILLVEDACTGTIDRGKDRIAQLAKGASDVGCRIPGSQPDPGEPEATKEGDETRPFSAQTPNKRDALPEIVRAFKTYSAKRINAVRRTPGQPVWQRNYYEHIVRNDEEWENIRLYVNNNPQEWARDVENPLSARRGGS